MGHKQNKSAGRVVYEAQNLDNFKGLKTNLKAAALQSTYTKDEKKPGLLNEENLLDE
jgi:hypothetical protein